MAQVTVFVDDAVLGRLPQICAKEGTPTETRLRIVVEVGRSNPSILWLLVLLGPLGWIALALLLPVGSSERLTVKVPFSESARDRRAAARRRCNRTAACGAGAASVGFLVLVPGGIGPAALLLILAIAGSWVAGHLAAEHQMRKASIDVDLDASRRWVTLRRVHPAFAAACSDEVSLARSA